MRAPLAARKRPKKDQRRPNTKIKSCCAANSIGQAVVDAIASQRQSLHSSSHVLAQSSWNRDGECRIEQDEIDLSSCKLARFRLHRLPGINTSYI